MFGDVWGSLGKLLTQSFADCSSEPIDFGRLSPLGAGGQLQGCLICVRPFSVLYLLNAFGDQCGVIRVADMFLHCRCLPWEMALQPILQITFADKIMS